MSTIIKPASTGEEDVKSREFDITRTAKLIATAIPILAAATTNEATSARSSRLLGAFPVDDFG